MGLVGTFVSALAAFAGGIALFFWLVHLARKADQRERRERAEYVAMGLVRGRDGFTGSVAGLTAKLYTSKRDIGNNRTRTWYHAQLEVPGLPAGFSVTPGDGTAPGDDTTVGDPRFDPWFRVKVPGCSLGLLDARARAAFSSDHHADLWTVSLESSDPWTPERVAALGRLATHLAARSADPWASLAELATDEPLHAVRLRAMTALAADEPERARPVFEAAAAGPDPTSRAAALIHLGRTDGLAEALSAAPAAHLHPLATTLAVGTSAQVAVALGALGNSPLPRPVWFLLTAAAAARPSPEVRRALLAALPHQAVGEDVTFANDRAAVALCGDPAADAEAALLPLLGSLDAAIVPVVAWLVERGTISAIPAIDEVVGRYGSADRARLAYARAAIQGRAAGERGGLAVVADPDAGGLSELSPEQRGALSAARQRQ
jgi:hypothetical protein